MSLKKLQLILVTILILVTGTLYLASQNHLTFQPSPKTTNLALENQTLTLKLLATPREQQQGLSGQTSLATDQGVLMVFSKPDRYGIWMSHMNFAIDVIWLNEQKQIIYLVPNMTPQSYPRIWQPLEPAKYIIETNVGTISNNQLRLGQNLNLSLN